MFLLAGKMKLRSSLWEKGSYWQVWFFLSFGNCIEDESILKKHKSVCKEESCKGNGLGWTHDVDGKFAYCLLVSVRWNSLAYQFKSGISLLTLT